MSYLPVIIVGAGRSGTNMLRDILSKLPGVVTWPCDEINYIWRHGNVEQPTDEFPPDLATSSVKRFIAGEFHRLAGPGVSHIVEKTCANSLRVEFVDRVLPNACYIHLVRDGRDVAMSAARRWTAPLDFRYILRKARFVPRSDLAHYAVRYFACRMRRLTSFDRRLSSWGPRFDGMDIAHEDHHLLEVCALQWQRCVDRADEAFREIPSARVRHFYYEDFVLDPATCLRSVGSFLGIPISPRFSQRLVADVSASRMGAARRTLETDQWNAITSLIHTTLERHHYVASDGVREAA